MTNTELARIKEKIQPYIEERGVDECWTWSGPVTVRVNGGDHRPSRLAYILATGNDPGRREVANTCKTKGCCNPTHVKLGRRELSHAPIGPPSLAFIKERIDRFIDKRGPNECWPWTGNPCGRYGKLWISGRPWRAHVLAYLIDRGTLNPGLQVNHACDVPRCCNPAHLWQGTQWENMNDMHNKDRGVYGMNSHFGKYPFAVVKYVRKCADAGENHGAIALRLGIHRATVDNWVANRQRSHAA